MAGLSRRGFLTAGALGTATVALERGAGALLAPEKPWNASSGRGLRKYRDPIPTACTACPAGCSILAFRDGDRVAQVGPNPEARALSAPCARAYEALEALYDPERVLRPLRRKGKRGEGKWEEISWGEALEQMAKVLREAPGEAYVEMGRPDPLAGTLLAELGVRNLAGEADSRVWASREAQRAVYGSPLGRPDVSKAQTIVFLGARPLEEGPCFGLLARDLITAKARGARLIAIGSYEGVTGSLAAEWIPCRPGAETLVALALVKVALAEGWADEANLGKLLDVSPRDLQQALLPYVPELAEAQAGIRAGTLVRLARRIALEGPSVALADEASPRAETLELAAALLSCLNGNPEAAGVRLAHRPGFVPDVERGLPRAQALRELLSGGKRASLYLSYRSNPVYGSPESESLRKAFADENRIGLLVAMDTLKTETAELADLILPAAADLELWSLLGGYTPDGKPYAILQQPTPKRPAEPEFLRRPGVVLEKLFEGPQTAPLGQARQLGDVLLEILPILGHPARERYPYSDCGAYVRKAVQAIPGANAAELLRQGAWVGPAATYPWAPSRKLRVGAALAREAPAVQGRDEGSFALVTLRHPELWAGYANTRWGREIRFENPLLMSVSAAEKMGLKKGDRVLVRSEAGQVTARVLPIQGIHPQAVALAEGFGHWAGGVAATAKAEATGEKAKGLLAKRAAPFSDPLGMVSQAVQPGEVPWWSHHGPGASVYALSPLSPGGKEIRVTVRKA